MAHELTTNPPTSLAVYSPTACRLGEVFLSGKGERLTGAGLYHLVQTLGRRAGLTVRPHGLRHAAIPEALEKTGGNVRAVQRFSRHRDLRTLTTYDDNCTDLAGEVAALMAGAA